MRTTVGEQIGGLPSKGSAVETVVPNLIRSSAQVLRLLPCAGGRGTP